MMILIDAVLKLLAGHRCRSCREWFPWSDWMNWISYKGMCCFCHGWFDSAAPSPADLRKVSMTAPRKGGTPPTSPWVFYNATDYAGNSISITVTFDASNNLTGASVFRDAACVYRHIYVGLGTDGTPNSTAKSFTVPAGTTNVTQNQLNHVGLNTVTDLLGVQVTAGP